MVNQSILEKTEQEMIDILGTAAKEYIAEGITANTVAAVGMTNNPRKELNVHLQAGKQMVNPMRSRLMFVHGLLEDEGLFHEYTAEQLNQELKEQSNNRVCFYSAKLFQDGSIQGLTAALCEPYENDSEAMGELIHEQDAFNEKLLQFHERGYRIAIHGNGDEAIGSIIDASEYILNKQPKDKYLHRIEHAQTATEENLNKMKKLDIAASFFINHIYYFGDRHANIFLGEERASRMNLLHSAHEKDFLFTVHSDCPITPISPLFSIWAAVNRVTKDGRVLGEAEKCDVITALKTMTLYGAELNFEEDEAGSIEVGKRADFAELNQDPTTIDPMEIKDIQALSTIIDGEIVFEK